MSLVHLAAGLQSVQAVVRGDGSVRVRDLRQDSRHVEPGDLFAARAGASAHGADYIPAAIAAGASAVMVEAGTELGSLSVPVLEVKNLRLGIALAAERIHQYPSRDLAVIGITGTNGKTTTAWLVEHALVGAGYPTGRLGTIGYSFGEDRTESALTTPEADVISRYLARARDGGAKHFVLEASSHALSLARLEALRFHVAAFTNLTQDHLDHHRGMEAYGDAKRRLFTDLSPCASVINVDDPFGTQLARVARGRVLRVSRGGGAEVFPLTIELDTSGIRGTIAVPGGEVTIDSRLVGEHNLDNLLCVVGIASALDLDMSAVAAALSVAPPAPGRLERCDGPEDDVMVLVDYAHTPDALERALAAVRQLSRGDLICVFGCGGDRDPGKRPKMGDAVGRGATRAIISNDNPRTEDARHIADMIEPAVRARGIPYEVILDRSRAIERAIMTAKVGDVVLIAGKGHEDYQIIGTSKRPFDDRIEAKRALRLRYEGER